jgi:hypothetical protein
MIAQRRGMKVSDIVSTRRAEDSEKSQAGENSEPTEVQA